MNDLLAGLIARQRTMLMILILLLTAGLYAYIVIPKESEPDINIPIITVRMSHDGISPEDAERLLIRPMEKELRGIEGAKEMTSSALEGMAYVTLEFEAGFDKEKAMNDVREKVDIAKAELPEDTDEPAIEEVNFALFPVVVVSLSGDITQRSLVRLARDLKDKIEGIPEVLEVDIGGDREEQVDIVLDPALLDAYGLTQEEMFTFAANNNRLVTAGALDAGVGRMTVKVPGLFETAEDILNLPVKVADDRVIRVSDVAVVRSTFKDAEGYARVNGLPAVTLEVKKRVGENVIAAVEQVKEIVQREATAWPEGIEYSFSQDQSKTIRIMLDDLQNNVLSAIVLVMIVVVAALGLRTGLLVGIAIPGSFLTGILFLFSADMTVNIVVLFSLILATGMLVDGAIVVTELADRKMNEGHSRARAYLIASQRMALPISTSTLTTLAAFAPLLFWPGVVGEFMKFLPITLIATLTASLSMALIFVPVVGALIGKPGPASKEAMKSLAAAEGGDIHQLHGITGWYVRTLDKLLDRKWAIVLLAVMIFLTSYSAYILYGRGVEFFPEVEPDRATLYLRMRGNLSLREMDALLREVEKEVLAVKGIDTVYARSEVHLGGQDVPEDAHASIALEFADWQERSKVDAILAEIRERTKDIAGILIEERKQEGGPPTGKPVQVELATRTPELLEPAIEKVRAKLESMAGLKDIDDTRPVPAIEWQVEVDRAQAGRYGADITVVGNAIQFVTSGLRIGSYRPHDADDEVDIRVRFPVDRRHLDSIGDLRIMTQEGLVPVSDFITQHPAPKVGQINRTDSRRILKATANLEEGVLADDKVREIREWLAEEANLDPRLEVIFRGEDEEQAESQAFLLKAFAVALFVMAIILVTQFNSFYQAFLILTAVIFSTVGVFLGLLLTRQPFGVVMNGIGVISLAGIVVNNNIVLIDTFDSLRRRGLPVREAVLRTTAQRFRPVMLTTITTVLGLLPMVLSLNIDFFRRTVSYGAPSTQWWTQLATSVAFGLAFATLITLVLTPALLFLGEKLNLGLHRPEEDGSDSKVMCLPPVGTLAWQRRLISAGRKVLPFNRRNRTKRGS